MNISKKKRSKNNYILQKTLIDPWDFYDFEADLPCFAWRWITVAMHHSDRSKGPNPCSWTAGTSRTLRTFLAGIKTIEVGLGLGFFWKNGWKYTSTNFVISIYKQFLELLINVFFWCLCVGFCSVVLNGSFRWTKYANLYSDIIWRSGFRSLHENLKGWNKPMAWRSSRRTTSWISSLSASVSSAIYACICPPWVYVLEDFH